MQRKIKVSEICNQFSLRYVGDDISINGLNLCNRESIHNCILTYVTNSNYADVINSNSAIGCILVSKELVEFYRNKLYKKKITFIICDNTEDVFYDIHEYLYNETDFYDKYEFETQIGSACDIHISAVMENGVIIGNNVKIGAHTVVKKGTIIKDNCIIGCNTTIGSEGFQIIKGLQGNRKIRHCGGLVIDENVCIGDNVTVCNSLFEDTSYIERNVMIDNNTYVAHNVHIGENAVITASVVLCGSTTIKKNSWIGVNSSVLNRVTIEEGAKIGIGSVVTRDVPQNVVAYGVPARVK